MKLVLKTKPLLIDEFGTIGRFITIDPGLGGTGWATWNRFERKRLTAPNDSGSIPAPSADLSMWRRIDCILTQIQMVCHRELVFEVIVECPQFFEGGRGLAAARDGDLVSLSILAGAILAVATRKSESGHLVTVNEWKGNMSKELTRERVSSKLPDYRLRTNTTHESDAVGLGLYVKGIL
jgi:hypothetical protein